MKTLTARFTLDDHQHGIITVTWLFDDAGQPAEVVVSMEGREHRVANTKGAYKPCATHAIDLARHVIGKEPNSNFAKQRKAKTRPVLGLVK